MSGYPTIGAHFRAVHGHPSGLNYMRLSLAVAILAWHCATFTDVAAPALLNHWPLNAVIHSLVPMFFGLSGFLVAGSLERAKSLITFLGLRGLRIFPALAVDTAFSALILGPLFTAFPLKAYFSAPEFYHYFLNMIGDVHFYLPGVFEHNLSNMVNGQLWTIPYELYCYLALTVLALCGAYRRPKLLIAIVIAMLIAVVVYRLRLGHRDFPSGSILVPCFLVGVVFYRLRDHIPWSRALFVLSLAAVFLLHSLAIFVYLVPLPTLYLTVFLGGQNPPKIGLMKSGDYSYGLYLYSTPILQALILTVPFARSPAGAFLVALPVAFAFAAMSWHLVEKHAWPRKPGSMRSRKSTGAHRTRHSSRFPPRETA